MSSYQVWYFYFKKKKVAFVLTVYSMYGCGSLFVASQVSACLAHSRFYLDSTNLLYFHWLYELYGSVSFLCQKTVNQIKLLDSLC